MYLYVAHLHNTLGFELGCAFTKTHTAAEGGDLFLMKCRLGSYLAHLAHLADLPSRPVVRAKSNTETIVLTQPRERHTCPYSGCLNLANHWTLVDACCVSSGQWLEIMGHSSLPQSE